MNIKAEQISENDPLSNATSRQIIDSILEKNRGVPGTTMVVLNELQTRFGYISSFA